LIDFLTDAEITSPNRIGEVSLIWDDEWIPTDLDPSQIDSSVLIITLDTFDDLDDPNLATRFA